MECTWKENWEETKGNFRAWWTGEGMVVGAWTPPVRSGPPRENVPDPGLPDDIRERHVDISWRALSNHWTMARRDFPLDVLPAAQTNTGPGSLALFLGSEPDFSQRTVWFHPTMQDEPEPENLPPLKFDPDKFWWRTTEDTLRKCREYAETKYMVSCPDLVENVDILASLRDNQVLLMDMFDRPGWVEQKLLEINEVWIEAYSRIYDIISLSDGSSCFGAFQVWGDGRTAKVQCDASAMFSPEMFERFVVPTLSEQCEWLDHSIFHLDGHQCICHLDYLLGIEALDAIEWTPDPMVPSGGSPEWYDMYRRILEAGKSVQAIGVEHREIEPLLDAVGTQGIYVMTNIDTEQDAETVSRIVEKYR